ncbi:MAG TPA: AAA family ATPase [Myxococcota bacterium]|nr:AAA family ATPase [Myxococcota bacterium]
MRVEGYRELSEFRRSRRSTVYRAVRDEDGASVVIKVGREDAAVRLESEFTLLQDLQVPGVAEALDFPHTDEDLPALVTADAGPLHLGHWRNAHDFDLKIILHLSIQLAEIVGRIHRRDIVHLDICPQNIVIDPDLLWLTIVDFARASRAPALQRSTGIQGRTAGGLRYIAPEQTGRMNRRLDHRADLYTMGAVLYELFCGRPAFDFADGLEMVHAHLARSPEPLESVDPQIPEVLARIVERCLAKTPEDRYQSAEALQADLRRTQRRAMSSSSIAVFELGRHDGAAIRFQDKLYGREGALTELTAALAASRAIATVALVTGPEGSGKSHLIESVREPVQRRGGLFLYGRFEPERGATPYAALATALRHLVRRIRRLPVEERQVWAARLERALDGRAAALSDLELELEGLVEMPPLSPLDPERSGIRFNTVLRNFVRSLCRAEQPLVLALDDLQRADDATIDFLASLTRDPSLRHLLIVGGSQDPGLLAGLDVVRIPLQPLDASALMALCGDAMSLDENAARALADMCLSLTEGWPMATRLLLEQLHEQDVLRFDTDTGTWTWDIVRLGAGGLRADIDEMIDARVEDLPADSRRLLEIAACLGSSASLEMLAELRRVDIAAVTSLLRPCLDRGLVHAGRAEDPDAAGWHFAHDRVRARILSGADADQRATTERQAGLVRLSHDQGLFRVVDHLNRVGAPSADEERAELADRNAEAARRARAIGAPQAARAYQARVLHLREPTREDKLEALRCAWLSGADEEAAGFVEELGSETVARLAVRCHVQQRRYREALEWGTIALAEHDVALPAELDRAIAEDLLRIETGARPPRDLLITPACTDADAIALGELLGELVNAAFFTDPYLFSWLQVRMALHSLEHGPMPNAAYAWTWVGVVLATRLDEPESGWALGRLGSELAELADAAERARVLFTFANHLNHWQVHLRTNRPMLQEAGEFAAAAGDAHFSAYARAADALIALSLGTPLDEVLRDTRSALQFCATALPPARGSSEPVVDVLTVLRQTVLSFQGRSFGPGLLDDASFELSAFLASADLNATSSALVESLQLMLAVHNEHFDAAARRYEATRPAALQGAIQLADHLFHGAVALAALDRRADLVPLRRELATWTETAPANFRHRLWLIDAEIARLEDRHIEAVELYDRAIDRAGDQGFVHDEALANARASRFHEMRGWDRFATVYHEAALSVAERWGRARPRPTRPRAQAREGSELDLMSVLEAAEAISSEVELGALLDRLMRVCLQAAGANRGVLLLERESDRAVVRVIGSLQGADYRVDLIEEDLDSSSHVPFGVVERVRRTWDAVVVDDAQHGELADDDHVRTTGVKSLLVLPIQRQSTLIGVFVLENTLVSHAFTPSHIGVLELLSSQIAISLAQSLMFEQLMEEIRERTLAEKALRRSELKYQSLYEHAPDVFVLWDARTRRIAQCNATTAELLGHAPKSLSGVPILDLFHPAAHGVVEAVLADFDRDGEIEGARLLAMHADGHTIPVLVNASAVREGDRVLYCQAVLRDITALEEARAQLEQANEDLEERVLLRTRQLSAANADLAYSNNELRQFAYLASHDLKSPIRRVASYLQLLQRRHGEVLDPGAHHYIDKAIESSVRMQALIDDVLAYSQVGRDRRPPGEVRSDRALQAAMENLSVELAESDAAVEAPDSMPVVLANETRLIQLFQNIVGNAVKYRDPGRSPVITVEASTIEGYVEFVVRDNGIGFDPDYNTRIFTIFKRLHHRSEYGGNGIGLAICKKIVEMHGGRIWAESEPGDGSTFHFTLPGAQR